MAKREYTHPLVIDYTPPQCPCGSESFVVYRTVPGETEFLATPQYVICKSCGRKRYLNPVRTFQNLESRFPGDLYHPEAADDSDFRS